MALELRVQVSSINKTVESAGYVVIDSEWNVIEKGQSSIDATGLCVIPVTNDSVELGQKVRPTIDDFNGENFDESGTATDWISVTEVYVDYSVEQRGVYVDCVRETDVFDDWDMGDGTVISESRFTHLYKSNGTYTIKNGDFSYQVTITGVTEFDVILEGNKITCFNQTGFTDPWTFGNGDSSISNNPVYYFYENGTYEVALGDDYSKTIVVDYYTNGLLLSVENNLATFALPDDGSTEFSYGDHTTGTDTLHEYPQGGKYLVEIGDNRFFVTIEDSVVPYLGFPEVTAGSPDSTQLHFQFPSATDGVSYKWIIEGADYFTETVDHAVDFTEDDPQSKTIEWSCVITDDVGNTDYYYDQEFLVEQENLPPTADIFITKSARQVNAKAINVEDLDGSASSVKYLWYMGDNYTGTYIEGNSISDEIVYEYEESGDYQDVTVTLKVTDSRGGTSIAEQNIRVYDEEQLGENLIANGDISDPDDYSGFQTGSASVEIVENVLVVTGTSGSQGRLAPQFDTTIGKQYKITVRYYIDNNSSQAIKNFVGFTSSPRLPMDSFIEETFDFYVVADESTGSFQVNVGYAGVQAFITYISAREVL